MWALPIGNAENIVYDSSNANDGGLFVCGSYANTSQLNIYATNGSTIQATIPNLGGYAGYVAKFTTSGQIVWYSRFDGVSGNESILSVKGSAVDGGVYFCGYFNSSAGNIYATNGQIIQTHGNLSISGNVAIVGKYGSTGSLLWTTRIDGAGNEGVSSLSYATDGGVYFGGQSTSTQLNIYATNGTTIQRTLGNLSTSGTYSVFLGKYGSTGTLLWTRIIDGFNNETLGFPLGFICANEERGSAMATVSDGIYIGGQTTSTQANTYNTGGVILTSIGNFSTTGTTSAFIIKYKTS